MIPVSKGLTMPGIVAKVFDIPRITDAWFGAKSRGFTLKDIKLFSRFTYINYQWSYMNPDQAKAPNPTATVMQATVPTGSRR